MTKLSVLDLAPVPQGSHVGDALRNSADLARHVEALGYHRYWVAEHHNMVGIASAATSVVIAHLAAATSRIRVGAGGVMLPNHSPLVIAEQFGTLEALYPGRIDLGLGRAPGTDQQTWRALRRDADSSERFPQDVVELQAFLDDPQEGARIQAVPGAGAKVPLWILGSSLFGAQLAAMLGLPYAFASHFAPDALDQAIELYRANFTPSRQLAAPYVMVGVHVYAGDTEQEGRRLFTSTQQQFANMVRGRRGKLQPPIDDIEDYWSAREKAQACAMLRYAFAGSGESVQAQLSEFIEQTGADEVMITSGIYDHAARRRSFEILAETSGLHGSAA